MSQRELVVLGTASQVPTRLRNHNGYVLLWDGEGILFDPGEGTQRQMLHAGVSATDLTRIAITHLHGDHALGLAGIAQRISLDQVPQTIPVHFPSSGADFVDRLVHATSYHEQGHLDLRPVHTPGPLNADTSPFTLRAVRLDHGIETYGYRIDEPDGTKMDPIRLAKAGICGPQVGVLQREGHLNLPDGRVVTLADMSTHRRGKSFALVMDTRLCDGVRDLANGVDLLVIESTYLDRDRALAEAHGHLTALQAATVAAEAGVRSLVLTHFSQRYTDPEEFVAEARQVFDGTLTVAHDLDRILVPR